MVNGKRYSYSAKVISNAAKIYRIDGRQFIRYFGDVIPDMKEMFVGRNHFLEKRYNELKYAAEYRSANTNSNQLITQS